MYEPHLLPGTVVVHVENTSVADVAVVRPRRLHTVAFRAVLPQGPVVEFIVRVVWPSTATGDVFEPQRNFWRAWGCEYTRHIVEHGLNSEKRSGKPVAAIDYRVYVRAKNVGEDKLQVCVSPPGNQDDGKCD